MRHSKTKPHPKPHPTPDLARGLLAERSLQSVKSARKGKGKKQEEAPTAMRAGGGDISGCELVYLPDGQVGVPASLSKWMYGCMHACMYVCMQVDVLASLSKLDTQLAAVISEGSQLSRALKADVPVDDSTMLELIKAIEMGKRLESRLGTQTRLLRLNEARKLRGKLKSMRPEVSPAKIQNHLLRNHETAYQALDAAIAAMLCWQPTPGGAEASGSPSKLHGPLDIAKNISSGGGMELVDNRFLFLARKKFMRLLSQATLEKRMAAK